MKDLETFTNCIDLVLRNYEMSSNLSVTDQIFLMNFLRLLGDLRAGLREIGSTSESEELRSVELRIRRLTAKSTNSR